MSYDIRQSQVIHTWPAGSMIDFPQLSLIMLNHDHQYNDWGNPDPAGQNQANSRNTVNDARLAEAFKVDAFILPPARDGISALSTWAIRFPRMNYCPQCGLMHLTNRASGMMPTPRGRSYNTEMKPVHCPACFNHQTSKGPAVIPMRFVIATEEGFLDDFPWDWYVHKNKPDERNKGNKLYYKSKGGSASLADIQIESRKEDNTFVAVRDLSKIFDQEIFAERTASEGNYLQYVNGFLPKPWKGWHNDNSFISEVVTVPDESTIWNGDELTDTAKRRFPRTLQKGAGNVIFPIVYSGILLPESTYDQQCPPEVQQKIQTLMTERIDDTPDEYASMINEEWKTYILKVVNRNPNHGLLRLGHPLAMVVQFISNFFGESPTERAADRSELLRLQEFKAFTGEINDDEKVWFKKRAINGAAYNSGLPSAMLSEVVLLEKISALKVYRGFTRVKPLMGEELVFADLADNLQGKQLEEFERIQDSRKDPVHTRELPAFEVKGEGILIRFSDTLLNEWTKAYPDRRLDVINNNQRQANADFGQNKKMTSKRYLFLHTLSHILLKELSEDCGYSLSSLAEIIYCSDDTKTGTNEEMNAILIYTTTSDAEGSLGGLVEKGLPENLRDIIIKGVDKARWCSSDPLCISADSGQGFMGLNLAACYSCVLLPETSCERMNQYLDRATIVGTLTQEEIGLFNH